VSPEAGERADRTVEQLIHAGHTLNAAELIATLAPTIIVRSPITQRIRFEGIDQAAALFNHVFSVIDSIEVYEHLGRGSSVQAIFWRGRVGREYLEEANLLHLDAEGRIAEMTVFMRPVPGLLELAAQLAPRLARDRSRVRAVPVRIMLRLFAVLYRSNERPILSLTGAGHPVKMEC
jgi:hypothetical protein